MIDGECPIFLSHVGCAASRPDTSSCAFLLCWKPIVWPTSCATTNSHLSSHQRVGQRPLLRARIEVPDLR